MQQTLFPTTFFAFSEYWWLYSLFIIFIVAIVLINLKLLSKQEEVMSVKKSLIWSGFWIILAMIFNLLFYFFAKEKAIQWYLDHVWAIPSGMTAQSAGVIEGKNSSLEFLTGYIIEKLLAVDNIFVFVMIFKFFGTPIKYQHKILFFGIIGALLFRAIFISIGAVLIEYDWIMILFGGFLILTGIKLLIMPEKQIEPQENFIFKLLYKSGRVSKKNYDAVKGRFFILEDGIVYISILFVTLVFIEFSDVIFALDSVPAIFAITRESLIVFTSNIFAILGLRSLYFLLANMVEKFEYLKYGLAIILIFIGIKMAWLNSAYEGIFSISISLVFIFTVLLIFVLVSVIQSKLRKLKN